MQLSYQYPSPSMCLQQDDLTVLGLSPDLSRDEKVSFVGGLKHPLIFRDETTDCVWITVVPVFPQSGLLLSLKK